MAVLRPIWTTKQETAGRVKAAHRRGDEVAGRARLPHRQPAGDAISAALPNNNAQITHRAALPHAQVGAAIAKVRCSGAYRGAVLSFEFLCAGPKMAGSLLPAIVNLLAADGAVSPDRAAAPAEDPRSELTW